MRKLALALTALVVAAIGCHKVLIKIERRSSAGVPDTGGIKPRHFFDGHYVPLPAKPFVNCFDLVARTMPSTTCAQDRAYPLRFAGYAYRQVARPTFDVAPSWLRSTSLAVLRRDLERIVSTFEREADTIRTAARVVAVETSAWTDDTGAQRRFVFATLDGLPGGPLIEVLNDEGDRGGAVSFRLGGGGAIHDGHLFVPASAGGAPPKPVLIVEDVDVAADTTVEVGVGLPRAVFSFVHLSDAQIREPEARLGGQQVSDTLDPLIESFAHDYEQELFSAFFYEAMIRTINDEIVAAGCDSDASAYLDGEAGHATASGRCTQPDRVRAGATVPSLDLAAGLSAARGAGYRIAPELAIHTGDSIDAGLVSEFREFLSRTDLLSIPWYSVVGNHDILGFGNLTLERSGDQQYTGRDRKPHHYACTPVTRLLREYYLDRPVENGQAGEDKVDRGRPRSRAFSFAPAALRSVCLGLDVEGDELMAVRDAGTGRTGTSLFIEAHCRGSDLIRHGSAGTSAVGRLADCGAHEPAAENASYAGGSRLNGFDLGPPARPGYYAFQTRTISLAGKTRGLWIIVLNTASENGAYGEICPLDQPASEGACAQLVWLEDVLTRQMKPEDLALVFGHHPIWGIEDREDREKLKELLSGGKVPAYFAGHTHSPQLRVVQYTGPGKNLDQRFWEVIASSTIAYPQQARQVTLKEIPGTHLAYLEVLTFEPHLEGVEQAYVERAQRGAERDACDQDPEDCIGGRPRAPSSHLIYPRLFFRVTN